VLGFGAGYGARGPLRAGCRACRLAAPRPGGAFWWQFLPDGSGKKMSGQEQGMAGGAARPAVRWAGDEAGCVSGSCQVAGRGRWLAF
jgi:hypothetical protein